MVPLLAYGPDGPLVPKVPQKPHDYIPTLRVFWTFGPQGAYRPIALWASRAYGP